MDPRLSAEAFPPLPLSQNSKSPLRSAPLTSFYTPNQDWKSLLSKQTATSDFNISYVPPVDGKISFSEEEIAEGSKDWYNSLIGCAVGKRPPYATLLAAVKRLWQPKDCVKVESYWIEFCQGVAEFFKIIEVGDIPKKMQR